ncbi:MAG: carboxymuconolactone decarboxylase family protein [Alphaproteobacteria bacterium]|nr:carboxymuconolactone decarboxylase family protein [Alphaproteobacteria bacterium]
MGANDGRQAAHGPDGTARVTPLTDGQMQEVGDIVEFVQGFSGYVPTSYRIMARKPDILRAFNGLVAAVMRNPGEVPASTKWLVAHAVSVSAGCRYCQAHTAANGTKTGIAPAKLEVFLDYETSDLYTPAERSAVTLALAAGQFPNATTPAQFDELRRHYSEAAIVEIVAVISLFGWLNRWNDTLASDLEPAPMAFAQDHLSAIGWSAGKHARPPSPGR